MNEEKKLPVKYTNGNVLLWAPVEEIESQALDQIRKMSELPWVHGVRVMADVHLGVGATIGSVIAMPDAVCPAAVGVDIGCLDKDTEYLSPSGWVKISEYDGGEVCQYDLHTGRGSFVEPSAYIVRPQENFLHFKTKYGIDQMLTPDHRVLRFKITGRNRTRIPQVVAAQELMDEHMGLVQGSKSEFVTAPTSLDLGAGVAITDADLRVHMMVCADSWLDGGKAVAKFKKQRKIDRAAALLSEANIEYSLSSWGDTLTYRFIPPVASKTMDFLWNCSSRQLQIIADEVIHWDGNAEDQVFYSRNEDFANFIHYAFMACGYRSVMRKDERDGAVDYRVYKYPNTMVGLGGSPRSDVTVVPSVDGKAYCFTVPSSYLIVRRNGNIFVTGNCGMGAIKTNLTSTDLPDSLHPLRASIEQAIPVGFNGHDKAVAVQRMHGASTGAYKAMWGAWGDLRVDVGDSTKARLQLGSLGGGNHFIEVCLDTEDNVWIMLHSGSRNIGKTLAEKHIDKAKFMEHNAALPDKNLAVFVAGSPELEDYRHDVMWAQQYAKLNREVMMLLVQQAVASHFPNVKFGELISCHHNYISEEMVDGQKMYVTRKGAISARDGEMGIIPGSMGAASFIVRGLGNEEGFNSASHGAGRKMSRSAAKKQFTVDDLVKATEGVECRKDQGVLDEIPSAYKSIEVVMDAQKDLVAVEARLKQILCVKG